MIKGSDTPCKRVRAGALPASSTSVLSLLGRAQGRICLLHRRSAGSVTLSAYWEEKTTLGYHFSDNEIREAVERSDTMAGTVRLLKARRSGANYSSLRKQIQRLKISTAHWTGSAHLKGQPRERFRKHSNERIFVRDSTYDGVRDRVLADKLLDYKCAECGTIRWRGKALTLHLDHINGDRTDNRLCNLRFLCPNCHSQTPTFGSAKLRQDLKCACGTKISRGRVRCRSCAQRHRFAGDHTPQNRKFDPSKRELRKKVWELTVQDVGRHYGVSATAVRKRCRLLDIPLPPQGFWAKCENRKHDA
jgi:hypothetical protein